MGRRSLASPLPPFPPFIPLSSHTENKAKGSCCFVCSACPLSCVQVKKKKGINAGCRALAAYTCDQLPFHAPYSPKLPCPAISQFWTEQTKPDAVSGAKGEQATACAQTLLFLRIQSMAALLSHAQCVVLFLLCMPLRA